ncbi:MULTISPECIES: alpha/beta fold hydrolase [unclassified Neorhizobium]|uniref:alpha/beta fold hydrolase n=1 Tax=unclassified Neorhizobium TaxID=2629175 RepID=UPI001FF51D69|nr:MULTISPECIES: alpha/beta hydrolase [unclassified Neorhizobium]MCJ9670893.1 alpha/beta hydrolase [Neorhizobium sp. SHOUNA12B]MCJ9745009.1 alpha/beta hydrolase [Neorhizobium sp. SHOUNA12A]
MRDIIKTLTLAATVGTAVAAFAQAAEPRAKPTIVLVHGAFADSSSWNGVIGALAKDGYTAIAAANPLRSVASDAATVASVLRSISGPVVLVGHSYGGPVITEAANGNSNVKALVYVAAFAPETGESSASLSGKFPGSTLGDALTTTALPGGGQDLYIRPDRFHDQFAADVPEDAARLMAATQRPIAQAALAEPSGAASWKTLPSYAIYGSADRNIPPAVMSFMAKRAHAVKTIVIEGGSHALTVSHPKEIASLIEEAASAE